MENFFTLLKQFNLFFHVWFSNKFCINFFVKKMNIKKKI